MFDVEIHEWNDLTSRQQARLESTLARKVALWFEDDTNAYEAHGRQRSLLVCSEATIEVICGTEVFVHTHGHRFLVTGESAVKLLGWARQAIKAHAHASRRDKFETELKLINSF